MAASLKMTIVFRDVAPCSLVETDFSGALSIFINRAVADNRPDEAGWKHF
jgi:hypothetical protein